MRDADLHAYVQIAIRRKWWIIATAIGVAVCTAVTAARLPNMYHAETVILVNSQQVPDKYVPDITTGDIAGRLTTLQQQVLSPTRLKTLVESEGLYPKPNSKVTERKVIKTVQDAITVELVNPGLGKMGSFRIAYSSPDRARVAHITNRLAQMFIDENLNARQEQTAGTAEFLESQLAETKQELNEKDAQLRAIKTHNVMELPESKPYHLEALAMLRGQAEGIQNKIQDEEREKSILQSMLVSNNDAPTVEVGGGAGTEDGGGIYQTQVQKLETKLSELRSRYGPAHPEVRRTQAQIDKLKAQSATAVPKEAADPADAKPAIQLNRKHHNPVLEAQIEQLTEDIQNQDKLLVPIQQQMELHTAKLEQIPVFEQQIGRLQQDYDIIKGEYKDLQDKKAAADISNALEVRQKGDRFVVLDAAVTPDAPASPNRTLIDLAGILAGILSGIGLAYFVETNDKSVRTERDVTRIFGKPVLTTTPLVITSLARRAHALRITGLLFGTTVGSAILGFILPTIAERLI